MGNEKNLKPNSARTPKEREELARKAGQASGKARREKKTAREYAIAVLEGYVKDKDITLKDAMMQKLIQRAITDVDLNAIKYILELIGESPAQRIEVTGKDGKDIIQKDLSRDEARELVKEMGKEFGWDSASK
ncbi:MAG: hypothetical protein IIW42_05770 [Bacteroidaceae bacterium]|nr:hypothetical protein [Bacteroidaceae bacterium]